MLIAVFWNSDSEFKSMLRRVRFLILAIILAWPHSALAHPHIFVRYDVSIAPADKGYIKLHFTLAINAPLNPLLTPGAQGADAPQLERDMLANLAAHPFYIYLDMDGENLGRQEVRPVLSGNGTYIFDLTLPDTKGQFGFSLYDPEYFVTVSQNGADAVKMKLDKTTCAVEEQKVGKTVWGIIRAQHVECSGKTGARPSTHDFQKMPPEDNPAGSGDVTGGRNLLP
jgi:ABC-type uncharacterized transport system substrate-binding protein